MKTKIIKVLVARSSSGQYYGTCQDDLLIVTTDVDTLNNLKLSMEQVVKDAIEIQSELGVDMTEYESTKLEYYSEIPISDLLADQVLSKFIKDTGLDVHLPLIDKIKDEWIQLQSWNK